MANEPEFFMRGRDASSSRDVVKSTRTGKPVKASNVEFLKASKLAASKPMRIRMAVVSVSDKRHLDILAKGLAEFGVKVVATSGTAEALEKALPKGHPRQLSVIELSKYTEFPENLNGRLKTLHPNIQFGVLAVRGYPNHEEALSSRGLDFFDLAVVDLYPFQQTVATGATFEECIENIDIGGPTLLRAAAKNYACVTAISSPRDYEALIDEMRRNNGAVTGAFRRSCAQKVFNVTTNYDRAISDWLDSQRGS